MRQRRWVWWALGAISVLALCLAFANRKVPAKNPQLGDLLRFSPTEEIVDTPAWVIRGDHWVFGVQRSLVYSFPKDAPGLNDEMERLRERRVPTIQGMETVILPTGKIAIWIPGKNRLDLVESP